MAMSRDEVAERRRAYWRDLLARWRASGLPQSQFCRRRGIPVWKLAWWRKRLAGERVAPSARFVPVRIVPAAVRPDRLELVLRGGGRLRFPADLDAARLTVIVAALETVTPAHTEGSAC